ncbi:MAG TPA: F0F1 ATP synthase subunit epsilon, partial [Hyphomicrobium sp.]|nr:F0F1 ATP synthase subunit epsilon [Hyphomicrobium sp.]
AQTFTFELVSPEKVLLSGQAEQVQLPGSEGDMTILPNHAPLISTLRPGVIDVVRSEGRARIFVRQAFAQVEPDRLTVLAEKAYDVSELKGAALSAEISAAEKDLADATTDEQRLVANQALAALADLRA